MFRFLFQFFSKIALLLIPAFVVLYSISTVLPDANLHKTNLRNDNFYGSIVSKSSGILKSVSDVYFNTLGTGFSSKSEVEESSVNGFKFQNKLEENFKFQTESFFDNLQNSITTRQVVKPNKNDYLGWVSYISSEFYSQKITISIIALVLLALIFVISLLQGGLYFSRNSRFYFSLFWAQVVAIFSTLIIFGGFVLLNSTFRNLFQKQFGITTIDLNLMESIMDIVNNQFIKFLLTLLMPAFYVCGAFLVVALVFGFLALFQRDDKEIQDDFDTKMGRQQDKPKEMQNNQNTWEQNQEAFNPNENYEKKDDETFQDYSNNSKTTQDSLEKIEDIDFNSKVEIKRFSENVEPIDPFLMKLSKDIDKGLSGSFLISGIERPEKSISKNQIKLN
jgi:hypothetical protein